MVYLLLIVIASAALVLFGQHSLIYHPRGYVNGFERLLPPGTIQLEYLSAAGKQLAFYLPPRSGNRTPRRMWVTFSGNASVALDWLDLAKRYPRDDDAFLLIDYPGYGRSEGQASIHRTRDSADRALDTLAGRLAMSPADLSTRLCVIGMSLGSAAALDFAAGHPVQRAVLMAPFTTLREEAAALFGRPMSWLVRENYDNRARLAGLAQRTPPPRVAIFHGTMDTLIKPAMGRALAESAPQITEFFPVENATHDTIFSSAIGQMVSWMAAG